MSVKRKFLHHFLGFFFFFFFLASSYEKEIQQNKKMWEETLEGETGRIFRKFKRCDMELEKK